MATAFSMLGIMNAALVSRGLDEIVTENDGTIEFVLLSRNWPMVVESALESGHYNFTKQQANLLSRQEGLFGYSDRYLLPLDALHVRRLWTQEETDTEIVRDLDVPWVQDGTSVHVNCETGVMIEYVKSEDPSLWSANFVAGIQLKLEAIIASSVWEEDEQSMMLERRAERYFEAARVNSSRSRSPTEPYRSGRFTNARFTRG